MNEAIGRIFRTALLCATLGLLLYAGMTYAVTLPGFAPLLGLAAAAGIGALVASLLWNAWRTGEFPEKFGSVFRDRQPALYWFTMVWYAACLACFIALAFLSLSLLIDAWSVSPNETL